MSSQKNTLSINGRIYDTTTGAIVKSSSDNLSKPNAIKTAPVSSGGSVLDGFFKGNKVKIQSSPSTPKPASPPRHSAKTAHKVHKTTQRSKTLMRGVVKKPEPVKSSLPMLSQSAARRQENYTTIHKSDQISRFGTFAVPSVSKKTAPLPVKEQSIHKAPASSPQATLGSNDSPSSRSDNLFNAALSQAESHNQPAHTVKKRKRGPLTRLKSNKLASVVAISLSVLVLGGFIAYLNMAAVSMRVATTRSQVNGSLPSYRPAGFSLDKKITYQPGEIVINFHSNSDARNFKIIQKNTEQNSETLLSSLVEDNKRPQIYESEGKTIYIRDDSNATWVDKNILYEIEGDSSLSSDQLLRLAYSI